MRYKSTRDSSLSVSASEAILKGLSDDGGLFVPETVPALEKSTKELSEMDYRGVAFEVMRSFLTDFSDEELKHCIASAYDDKFDSEDIAPLTYADNAYYLELFHGPTIAFKDMALTILPHLMITAAKKNNIKNDIVILTATSGDTGKAALAGFADVKGTKIMVFYPKDGVSNIQRLQMVTQKGDNTSVIGVDGNFDDCQTGVKNIFRDKAFKQELSERGYQFSSANSINIGRLVPQVVYYVYAYCSLVREGRIADGDKINVCVPTGNFGNILAAFYAKNMGLPIDRLICASNENKVLFDFFNTGTYDRNRKFVLTSSPSMDILISSNLERLIYYIAGCDSAKTLELMSELAKDGRYTVTKEMKDKLISFDAGYADENETAAEINRVFSDTGYIMDTHTAVASGVYSKLAAAKGYKCPVIIASTASPFKFARSVMTAVNGHDEADRTDFDLIEELSKAGNVEIPAAIREIMDAKIRHNKNIAVSEMKSTVEGFLR